MARKLGGKGNKNCFSVQTFGFLQQKILNKLIRLDSAKSS
jgi:hypothetical protein